MIGQEVTCAREECETVFIKTTHNQKYCGPACCRIDTNARIMKEYHRNAAILRGLPRKCARCEVTSLSRYNPSDICAACSKVKKEKTNDGLSGMLNSVQWL